MPDAAPVEEIMALLRARGGRATSPRRATIAALVEADGGHLTAEQIVEQVRARQPDVAESTVYRTLTALEELGVVAHVHLGHGPSTYHLAGSPHQHLVCERCGTVVEVPDGEFAALAAQLDERYGFEIHPRHFAIPGRCRACRNTGS